MKWKKHDSAAIVSEDGCYSIAKIGGSGGYRYEVYRTRRHPEGVHLVAHNIATPAEARKLAQADSESE
jgi:hypothetical protein